MTVSSRSAARPGPSLRRSSGTVVAAVEALDDWDDGFEDYDYDGPVRD